MIFQGILFYQTGQAGWSSVYYIDAVSHDAAKTKLDAINSQAVFLMHVEVSAIAARVSDVQVRGDGLLFAPTATTGSRSLVGQKASDLNLAARFLFQDATLTHRVNHFIHGLELQDLVVVGGQDQLDPGSVFFLTQATDYINAVLANSVNWQKRTIPPTTAPLTIGRVSPLVSVRRIGRPFGLQRGRRRIA